MRIIPFTVGNMHIRHSVVRLSGENNMSIKTINDFLLGETRLTRKDSAVILQADRCVKFIEGIRKYKMPIDSEDYIITLVTFYPHDMMEESSLRAEFPKEMKELNRILKDNLERNLPVFTAAKNVLDFVTYSRLVKANTLPVVFLLANLMIVHSQHLLVLEDTDSVDPGLLLAIQMEVEKNA